MRALVFPVLAVLLLAGGCKRPKPSLEYTEAAGKHSNLVAELGDDAYLDEQMSAVEALLARVPVESTDAAAAAELSKLIVSERKRVEAEAARHQRELDSAGNAPDLPDSPRTPEAAGGGAGDSWELTAGMTVADVNKVSGDCFSRAGSIKLRKPDDTELDGEVYQPRDSATCRERYAQYTGRVLVFRDGKLAGNFTKSELQREAAPTP